MQSLIRTLFCITASHQRALVILARTMATPIPTPMMATPAVVQATPGILPTPIIPGTSQMPPGSATAKAPPSSMSEIVLEPLNELQSLAQSMFHTISHIQHGPPNQSLPPLPIQALLEADASLAAAVRLARKHQIKQRRIERLKNEVLAMEERWRDIIQGLDDGKRELEVILTEGKERTKAIEEAKAASIPYPELLAYAQSLSAFTSAPPNMPDLTLPGQPPPPLFFPPFPNEEKMRRGYMNDEAPLGLIGETHSVGKPPTISPRSVELPPHLAGANPYRPDHPMAQQPQVFDLDLDLNPDL
ncbi:hypothetical protein NM688_g3997 [Phlebia brevispora]|uniref:Uncharacterized protein n=1 Tax=Phlebia brevispora TaxID=194682 RepID=A0ACC1T466_9APHY|nr:hypothetical protein NM688_g3997 [Phlebia brevispora]